MNDTNNTGEKTLGATPSKTTLHLKRPVEQGMVRQSFSHGRSKAVVVEKVKRRIPGPGEALARESAPAVLRPAAAPPAAAPVAPRGPTSQAATARAASSPSVAPPKTGVVLPSLTEAQ